MVSRGCIGDEPSITAILALIDSDNVAFACAASAEDAEEEHAIARAQEMVFNILRATGADQAEL